MKRLLYPESKLNPSYYARAKEEYGWKGKVSEEAVKKAIPNFKRTSRFSDLHLIAEGKSIRSAVMDSIRRDGGKGKRVDVEIHELTGKTNALWQIVKGKKYAQGVVSKRHAYSLPYPEYLTLEKNAKK